MRSALSGITRGDALAGAAFLLLALVWIAGIELLEALGHV